MTSTFTKERRDEMLKLLYNDFCNGINCCDCPFVKENPCIRNKIIQTLKDYKFKKTCPHCGKKLEDEE